MRKIKYNKVRYAKPLKPEYMGVHSDVHTEAQLFVYDKENFKEIESLNIDDIKLHINLEKVNWYNIHGLNDTELITKSAELFGNNQFILYDIFTIYKRTKIEEFNNTLFFNVKSLVNYPQVKRIKAEQISFVLTENLLISYQEKRSDYFNHIRERIRNNYGIVRTKKADYLLYLLLDSIIENFYETIENEENNIDNLIDYIKQNATQDMLEEIENQRDNLVFVKRSILPLRDSLYSIISTKDDDVFNCIQPENYSFYRRLYQKCLELLEQIDTDLSTLDNATNFFFSAQNHKMNQTMKTLTGVSLIFMPLTFIVGVYGMNFKYMPELYWKYGYYAVWAIIIIISLGLIIYFKKKKWF